MMPLPAASCKLPAASDFHMMHATHKKQQAPPIPNFHKNSNVNWALLSLVLQGN
jgi:hypothetical protein